MFGQLELDCWIMYLQIYIYRYIKIYIDIYCRWACATMLFHHASAIEAQKSSNRPSQVKKHPTFCWPNNQKPIHLGSLKLPLIPHSSGWLTKCPIKCGSKNTMPFREMVAGEAWQKGAGCPRHRHNMLTKKIQDRSSSVVFSKSSADTVSICRSVLA